MKSLQRLLIVFSLPPPCWPAPSGSVGAACRSASRMGKGSLRRPRIKASTPCWNTCRPPITSAWPFSSRHWALHGNASPRRPDSRCGRRSTNGASLPGPTGSPKLALLAGELADRTGDLGPAGRHDAVPLAVQILQGPLDADSVDAVAVIGCCERVLRAAQADTASLVADALAKRAKTDSTPATNPGSSSSIATSHPFSPNQNISEIDASADNLSHLHDVQPKIESLRFVPALDSTDGKSNGAGVVVKPLRPVGHSPQLLSPAVTASSRLDSSGDTENQPVQQASATENLPASGPSDELKSVASFELLERTCSTNAAVTAPARAELSRRGFTEVHFDLAKRLFNADPAVRKQLARALPGLRRHRCRAFGCWNSAATPTPRCV